MKHIACDECGSSDANSLYSDGHTHCFSCGTTVFPIKEGPDITPDEPVSPARTITPVPTTGFLPLHDRNISDATAKRYGVTNVTDEANPRKHVYPYFDPDGRTHVANKIRYRAAGSAAKPFSWEGPPGEAGLFGQQLFPPGSAKYVTLVEGECDALAAYQMMGSRWPVVSVKNGADGAVKDVAHAFEYLNSFATIVVCFDRDEAKVNEKTGEIRYPGQEAAIKVANMFEIGKVKILTLQDHKDANDYLIAGQGEKFNKEWWAAPSYTPTGLKVGKDMWDEISAPKKYDTIPYPWAGLNDKTYGLRLSEFVVATAETGIGKTSILKEIEHFILHHKEERSGKAERAVGLLHLEEPNSDTALGLMSITADKPLHLPDVRETVEDDELKKYFDATVNTDRLVIWDHFGSNSVHEVLQKIRHMHNMGCKYIILDHLSIIVSDQNGDERKQLDEIATKIKTLCMELNISVIAVIHTNRQGQIRGTAGVEQLANIVIRLHRNKKDPDDWRRNVTFVEIEKNRFCGRTGPACWLHYNEMTGRLVELDKDEVEKYMAGGTTEKEQW